MRVLVTGAAGQLGRALVASAPANVELVALDRAALDLADPGSIEGALRRHAPQLVLNAGAFTAVDRAEAEPDRAHAVNATAVAVLARECAAREARLIHVSTDYVFDGRQGRPYRPDDATAPLNVYGATKLAGERALAAQRGLQWAVFRTAWVYAADGRNFLRTMLRLFGEGRSPGVVDDQFGTPTHAVSLAGALWRAVADDSIRCVQHYTDAGVASWYDFAVAILEEARARGLVTRDEVTVQPIPTHRHPTPAQRPPCGVLDKTDTWARLGGPAPHWRAELRRALDSLATETRT